MFALEQWWRTYDPAGQTLAHEGFLNVPRVDFYKLIFYVINERADNRKY